MGDELQELRKQVEELTELVNLHSQRAMDYAGMAMRKHKWVGLEEVEIDGLRHIIDWTAGWSYGNFARAIEAKLKEKNNG